MNEDAEPPARANGQGWLDCELAAHHFFTDAGTALLHRVAQRPGDTVIIIIAEFRANTDQVDKAAAENSRSE